MQKRIAFAFVVSQVPSSVTVLIKNPKIPKTCKLEYCHVKCRENSSRSAHTATHQQGGVVEATHQQANFEPPTTGLTTCSASSLDIVSKACDDGGPARKRLRQFVAREQSKGRQTDATGQGRPSVADRAAPWHVEDSSSETPAALSALCSSRGH